jgi:hypothetical protein
MVPVDFFAFGLCMRRIWSIRQSCVSPVVLSHLADARGDTPDVEFRNNEDKRRNNHHFLFHVVLVLVLVGVRFPSSV